ncbi:Gfo/Idh/MocA family oxidoreductase [Coraliomargarita sp. SDUM461004]|uniref:Gfo/Idh/MocA family oxidoreductase n=1 Tax=Thalassobacterium sedimentorum TaxID=3041258 RepID=A0ABU1AE44_9BACT|nr:Gfo/Idh/MocA family oxidoreductase [Coraliomargarita sp. SDUM461004]MDQ8192943.1 Gfo/Idh/MocA family oxidoreductase [Coraliomargarita sp. SDUM461004]
MKVAIIGLGFMGGMHAQIYKALPGVELVAVASLDVAGAKDKVAKLGLDAEVFDDFDTLLANTDVDVIDICLPTDLHAETAIKAANAGKHLFIEKPLSLTLENCEAIQAAISQGGVFSQVGHCIRFWPEYVALKKFIDSGKAGALKSISLHRRAARPTYSQYDWLNDETRSGGAAVDLHIHDADFIIHLFGLPNAVKSQATRGRSGNDHIFTHYQYADVTVHGEGGWDYPEHYGFSMAFEAIFENGSLSYDSASGKAPTVVLNDTPAMELEVIQPGPKQSTIGEGNLSSLGGYYNELEYFINCLTENMAPQIATVAQATESLRVILAELKSAETGKVVQL